MTTTAIHSWVGPLAGNGTNPLPFDFQAISVDEVGVFKDDVAISSGYTVVLNADGTGSVTPDASWTGSVIFIYSKPDWKNETDFPRFEKWYPDQLDFPVDKLQRQLIALRNSFATAVAEASSLPSGSPATVELVVLPWGLGFAFGLPTGAAGPAGDVAKVVDRTELGAIAGPAAKTTRWLAEAGRNGLFEFDTSDLSAQVTADPTQLSYVAPASDPTGATGAWVRKQDSEVRSVRGAGLVGFQQAGSNPSTRTAQDKLREIVSTTDFTSHANADAAGKTLYVPTDITSTRANGAAVVSLHYGPGRLTTADGNKRGKQFSQITAAPAAFGDHNSIETAFNGDLSKSLFQMEHRITGSATLGQPSSGYLYRPEAMPFYGVLYNSSGHNEGLAANTGRTGTAFFRVNVQQYGQGDAVAFNATGIVNSTKPGSTSFLANPAAVLFNGDLTSGVDGAYLNPRELSLNDGGHDVACIGDVINMDRSVETGAKQVWWGGYRVQSNGSKAVNNLFSATGKCNVGLDFSLSSLNLGTNKCAISLKANDRIYFNNFSTNGNFTDGFQNYYLEYNSGNSAIQFVIGGVILSIASDRVTFAQPPKLPVTTSGSLPSAATRAGMEYYVSDANATTRGTVLVGGGANFQKVYSNGTNWIIA